MQSLPHPTAYVLDLEPDHDRRHSVEATIRLVLDGDRTDVAVTCDILERRHTTGPRMARLYRFLTIDHAREVALMCGGRISPLAIAAIETAVAVAWEMVASGQFVARCRHHAARNNWTIRDGQRTALVDGHRIHESLVRQIAGQA